MKNKNFKFKDRNEKTSVCNVIGFEVVSDESTHAFDDLVTKLSVSNIRSRKALYFVLH